MEKKEIKPALTYFNEVDFNGDLHKLESHIVASYSKKIEEAFEVSGLGKLNDNYLNAVLSQNLSCVRKEVENMMKEHLNPEYLPEEFTRNVNSRMRNIEIVTRNIHASVNLRGMQNLLEFLSVDENCKITVSDEDKERLKNTHRTFAVTKKGIERYNLHLAACEAINKFCEKMGRDKAVFPMELFCVDEDNKVIPHNIYYE